MTDTGIIKLTGAVVFVGICVGVVAAFFYEGQASTPRDSSITSTASSRVATTLGTSRPSLPAGLIQHWEPATRATTASISSDPDQGPTPAKTLSKQIINACAPIDRFAGEPEIIRVVNTLVGQRSALARVEVASITPSSQGADVFGRDLNSSTIYLRMKGLPVGPTYVVYVLAKFTDSDLQKISLLKPSSVVEVTGIIDFISVYSHAAESESGPDVVHAITVTINSAKFAD